MDIKAINMKQLTKSLLHSSFYKWVCLLVLTAHSRTKMADFRKTVTYLKNKLLHNSCRDLIWFINILPTLAGFSFSRENITATFWILHTLLSLYVYVYSTVLYEMYYANTYIESVNSYLNISIFILIVNSSVWTLSKRYSLKVILKLITRNDDLVKENSAFLDKQWVYLRRIKFMLILYYMFHFINDFCIFIPTRSINLADGTIGTCFGLEPMDKTPNREICMLIVTVQEITSMVAVASYDVTLIFLLAHTTAMYNILCEDILSLDDINNQFETDEVSQRLKNYIVRHSFLLQTVRNLQEIYSFAIGVGFGVNAMSLCLFLFLPLELWFEFAPIVYYSLCVFFLYCFQGQRLTTATERLEMAVYCCGWEKFCSKNKKMVLVMLKQSQKPVVLLAAHIVPIRIYTFATTMQSIYKFVAIFKL